MWKYEDEEAPKGSVKYEASPNGYVPAPGSRMGSDNQPVLREAPAENWDETIRRKAADLFDPRADSLTVGIANFIADPLNNAIIRRKARDQGLDEDEAVETARQQMIAATKKYRADTADYSERQDALAGRGGFTTFIQDVAANILGDPAQSLPVGGQGKTILGTAAREGLANLGIDAAQQGSDIYRGIQDDYNTKRGAINLGSGALLGGGLDALARGVNGEPLFGPKSGTDTPDVNNNPLDFERAGLAEDPAQDIKSRWTQFWNENEAHKAQTGENAPNFDELAKEFEGLYQKYLPDEDFNPNWNPEEGPIVVDSRKVEGPVGADAEFNAADESFTNALVTGQATPEIESTIKGMEEQQAPRVGLDEAEIEAPSNVAPLNRETPPVEGVSDALIQLRKMANDMHMDAEAEGGKYPLAQLVAIHKKITEKLDEGSFKGADLEEAKNIKDFLDEAIYWRDQAENGITVPDGVSMVQANRGAGDIQRTPANDVEGVQLRPTEEERALYLELFNKEPTVEDLQALRGVKVDPKTGELTIYKKGEGFDKITELAAQAREDARIRESRNDTGEAENDNFTALGSGSGGREPPRGGSGGGDGSDPRPASERLKEALEEATTLSREQKRMYTEERRRRLKEVLQARNVTDGEAGYRSEASALKGQFDRVDFEGVRDKFSTEEVDDMFDEIKNSDAFGRSLYEPITARAGLAKLLDGEVPAPSQLAALEKVFGKEFVATVKKHKSRGNKVQDLLTNALNLPRSLMASFDLSAPLRQGIFLIGSKEFWRAWPEMFKAFGSERAFKGIMDDIQNRQNYPLMEESGLAVTDLGGNLSNREEDFISQWAEKIPLVGRGVKASERAYVGFLNKLRADTFDNLMKQYADANGGDLVLSEKALKDVATFINNATGRGNLGKTGNAAAPWLNGIFFSPRLIASRVNLLNPAMYYKLDPIVRKQALKSLISFGTIATTVAGLASMAGFDVETDPRSSDFAKIKEGDTRYDILGGFGQYLTLGARLATNETKTLKGDVRELGKGYKADTRKDVVEKFLTNKFAPVPGYVRDYLQGSDPVGNEFEVKRDTAELFVPLLMQDLYDLYQQDGLAGLAKGAPGVFGVGIGNYAPKSGSGEPKEAEEDSSEETEDYEEPTSNQWTYED